jgi:hypothetical protein
MSENELVYAARKLSEVIDNLDQSKPLLREAYTVLRPIVNDALAGKLQIPGQLPHRIFFFGMYEDSLPAHYLSDTIFMNALGEFDEAWRQAKV